MWKSFLVTTFVSVVALSYGQLNSGKPAELTAYDRFISTKIGNFSLEILYSVSKTIPENENLIISPITVWTVLAVIAEGAADQTLRQIKYATRITNLTATRSGYSNIARWLRDNTSTVELAKVNAIFIDKDYDLVLDFQETAQQYYDAYVEPLNFADGKKSADKVNKFFSDFTHGRIPNLVDSSNFDEGKMLLTSALYFKGQWTSPFNTTSTLEQTFYDSNGRPMGKVNMMYKRFNYPFANIKEIGAGVLEIPYGKENRLSMLVMLPQQNVTLEEMFLNFSNNNITFDNVFKELKTAQEEYDYDAIDCFLPRFKIESNINMNSVLQSFFGIVDLFDQSKARLIDITPIPLYVSKVVHKAEIEVTEEGTVASALTGAELGSRIATTIKFEANHPFVYMIVEKVTNTIVFGGLYRQPSLY